MVTRALKTHGEDSPTHRSAIAKLDALNGPDTPESLDYLRAIFFSIRRFLEPSMSGPARVTWVAIDAWERHAGYRLGARELDALAQMDLAYCYPDADR
jgi:hypothetical protein